MPWSSKAIFSGVAVSCICCLFLLLAQAGAAAETTEGEEDTGRLYLTRSERREVGIRHSLDNWLSASFLLEMEGEAEWSCLEDRHPDRVRHSLQGTMQVGLFLALMEHAKAEIVLELDTEARRLLADEAFLSFEMEDWELEVGKMYTPFGVYISHFSTGPLLEYGETRANAVNLSYGPSDWLELSAFLYRSDVIERGRELPLEWGLASEAWLADALKVGFGFQSAMNLGDELVPGEAGNTPSQGVSAVNGYLIWSSEQQEISGEFLAATGTLDEDELRQYRPIAWNMEYAHFYGHDISWALRMEASRGWADSRVYRAGLSLSWRISRQAALTVEYLYTRHQGRKSDLVRTERLDAGERFAVQVSIFF